MNNVVRPKSSASWFKLVVCFGIPLLALIIGGTGLYQWHPDSESEAFASDVIAGATALVAAVGLSFAALAVWLQHDELHAAMSEIQQTKVALESQAKTMQHQADLALVTSLLQSKQMLSGMYAGMLPDEKSVRNTIIPGFLNEIDNMDIHDMFQWKKSQKGKPAAQLAFYIKELEGIHGSLAFTSKGVLERLREFRQDDVSTENSI